MATKQGDTALLNDPVAKELLQSTIPARFAYTWTDGTPRVVPIWFHWNGDQIVLGTPPTAPKMRALVKNPKERSRWIPTVGRIRFYKFEEQHELKRLRESFPNMQ